MTYNAEQRRKQSDTIKGRGNPNWKGGRIQKVCVRCSSPFLVYPGRKDSQMHCSLKCANRDTAEKQRGITNPLKIHRGESNGMYGVSLPQKKGVESHAWKGGITPLYQAIRTSTRFKEWREAIFDRDDFTCQDCRRKGNSLEAHHIRSAMSIVKEHEISTLEQALECEELWDIENGKTLCRACHSKTPNFCRSEAT